MMTVLNKDTYSIHHSTIQDPADNEGNGSANNKRPPILLMHALMQDSESFLCGGEHSLALYLADAGFDVWLGKSL